jgi:hypothetical protein
MAGKDMDLMMRIRADGEQAIKFVARMENALNTLGEKAKQVGTYGGAAFGFLGRTTSMILAPLKTIAAVGGGVAAIFGGLATKAVMAAAGEEKLASRFTMLYGSVDKAKKKMAELEGLALGSSFSKDDLAEAAISLEHVGLGGAENLKILGAAAKVANKSVTELAMDITALRSRSLKQMGITMETKDDKFIFSWRDKMGAMRKIVAKDANLARLDLLKILNSQYGNDISPKGLTGMISRMKNQIDSGFERFGEPLLKHAEQFVKIITEKLGAFITSGKLEKWGEVVADKLQKAFIIGKSVFEYASGVIDALSKQDPKKWGDALSTVFSSAAQILAIGFMAYLQAGSAIFAGIGKIIAGTFMEDILQLPGMGRLRENMMNDQMDKIRKDPEEWIKTMHEYKIGQPGGPKGIYDLSPAQQAKIATRGGGDVLKSGVDEFTVSIPKIAKELQATVSGIITDTKTKLEDLSGYKANGGVPFDKLYEKNEASYQESLDPQVSRDLVTAVRMERRSYREGNTLGTRMEPGDSGYQFLSDPGKYQEGQQKNGYIIMNVQGDLN